MDLLATAYTGEALGDVWMRMRDAWAQHTQISFPGRSRAAFASTHARIGAANRPFRRICACLANQVYVNAPSSLGEHPVFRSSCTPESLCLPESYGILAVPD